MASKIIKIQVIKQSSIQQSDKQYRDFIYNTTSILKNCKEGKKKSKKKNYLKYNFFFVNFEKESRKLRWKLMKVDKSGRVVVNVEEIISNILEGTH